jgi:lipopolysaccharide export system protein LptA
MDHISNRISKTASLTVVVKLVLCLVLLSSGFFIKAQKTERKKINMENADLFLFDSRTLNDVQRLLNNVILSHNHVRMYCDSAWVYNSTNSVDAFGRVHIISNDTLHMYANFIHYDGQTSLSRSLGNVVLKDPKITLTTDTLDYDMKNDIGYYECGGTIVDSTNTLTSKIGRYYSKENLLFFKDSVKLVNKDYTMLSDTMKYNTKNETVYILGPTYIYGDSTDIYSEEGWFDTKNKVSELLKNSTVKRGDSQLQADTIYYEDVNASGEARSNMILTDFARKLIIKGNYGWYNDFSQNATATDSAVFILYDDKDSLFLHADTLNVMPDTSATDERIVTNYHNVRFYRTDMQGACDSLVYYSKDSTIRLYRDPILWSEENQMTADFIELINNADAPNEVYLNNNSFIIQQVDPLNFNQIKGKNMIGYIQDQNLYLVDVKGNGESIFFPEDEQGAMGVNKAESSNIRIYLGDNKIKRITFVTSPTGTMKPLTTESPETKLEGFDWRQKERPLNRLDIFRKGNEDPYILPDEPKTIEAPDSNHNLLPLEKPFHPNEDFDDEECPEDEEPDYDPEQE